MNPPSSPGQRRVVVTRGAATSPSNRAMVWAAENPAVVIGVAAGAGYVASHLALSRYASRYGVAVGDLDISVQDRLLLAAAWATLAFGPFVVAGVVSYFTPRRSPGWGVLAGAGVLWLSIASVALNPVTKHGTVARLGLLFFGLFALSPAAAIARPGGRRLTNLAAPLVTAGLLLAGGVYVAGRTRIPEWRPITVFPGVTTRQAPWLYLVLPTSEQGLLQTTPDAPVVCATRIAPRVFQTLMFDQREADIVATGSVVLSAEPYSFTVTYCSLIEFPGQLPLPTVDYHPDATTTTITDG